MSKNSYCENKVYTVFDTQYTGYSTISKGLVNISSIQWIFKQIYMHISNSHSPDLHRLAEFPFPLSLPLPLF